MTFLQSLALAFPPVFITLFIVSAVLSAVGFIKFVYFLSIGYGFSVAGLAITLGILFRAGLDAAGWARLLLLVVYGLRLGGFLLLRELKSAGYREVLANSKEAKAPPIFVQVAIWLVCALLYVSQVSPALYSATLGQPSGVLTWIGVAIMAASVFLESLADMQKSAAKKKNPKRFCDSGLFRLVRCPNYFAEMCFWTGVVISGLGSYLGWAQWTVVLFGYICILYVMMHSARRLEKGQNERYGEDAEYQAYVRKTPILLPLIPLYTLQKKQKNEETVK